MSMAFKKISFEESLELAPLSEDELKELQDELESDSYYNPFDCKKQQTLTNETMSDLNKHDKLQAIFDDLSKQDIENCETIGDIEKLVNEIYESELM